MKTANKLKKIIFYITLFLMSFMFSITKNCADLDLWHRMAVGKIFSQLGHVINHDIFAYFPTKPIWIDIEWLSGVIFYNLSHYFGDSGILILKIVILFSIIVLIYKTNQLICPEPDKQRIGWYFVTLAAMFLGIAATLRCQAFTYLFFTLWIYVLEKVRKGENRLIWIFPATMLIWTNVHGGFVAGFGLLVFYAVGEFLNCKANSSAPASNPLKYVGIIALCLPFTLINPYGLKYWREVIQTILMPRPYITEWKSLNPFEDFYKIIGTKIQFLLLAPALIYKIFSKNTCLQKNKLDWVEIIAFIVTLGLSFKTLKHIPLFSIIVSVYGYKYFAISMDITFNKLKTIKNKLFSLIPENKHQLIYFAKFVFVYSFIINISLIIINSMPREISLSLYPTKAVEFIKINKLKGNLLIPFNWGSYALWKLYPQNLVSMDGRYNEPYTNKAYMDLSAITFYNKEYDCKKWKETFYKYHHDIILIEKDNKIQKNFRKLKEWKVVYEDKKAVVFVPSSTPAKKWIQPNKNEEYYIKTKYENNINF